jgi:hypothetical protein
MAKKRKLQINWNGLNVDDINGIIAHFAAQEQEHIKELAKHCDNPPTPYRIPYLKKSIQITQSYQRFWKEMVVYKERGEKISPHVREYIAACRNCMEFKSW